MPAPQAQSFSVAFVAALALLTAACNRSEPTAVVKADGKAVVVTGDDGAQVEVADDGESLGGTDAFPSFAPAYPGAKVTTRLSDPEGRSDGGMWVMETADPVEKVAAFYDAHAEKSGLKPGMFVNEADSAVRIFAGRNATDNGVKGAGALIAISREAGEDITRIVITAGTKVAVPDGAQMREGAPMAPPQRLQ